jgi:hypothetical protein
MFVKVNKRAKVRSTQTHGQNGTFVIKLWCYQLPVLKRFLQLLLARYHIKNSPSKLLKSTATFQVPDPIRNFCRSIENDAQEKI